MREHNLALLRSVRVLLVTDLTVVATRDEFALPPTANLASSIPALLTCVEEALQGGIRAVQLRARELGPAEFAGLAYRLHLLCRNYGALLIVNHNVEVACALPDAAINLGTGDLPLQQVRRQVGPAKLLGWSAHSVAESVQAELDGADYVILGTIFATASKPGKTPAGLALVRDAARVLTIPIIAIGGIERENAAQVLAAGATGVAVIRAILGAPDVRESSQALLAVLDRGVQEANSFIDTQHKEKL